MLPENANCDQEEAAENADGMSRKAEPWNGHDRHKESAQERHQDQDEGVTEQAYVHDSSLLAAQRFGFSRVGHSIPRAAGGCKPWLVRRPIQDPANAPIWVRSASESTKLQRSTHFPLTKRRIVKPGTETAFPDEGIP